MPKIDTSLIEGYDTMTDAEKLAALEAFEYDDNSEELTRYKNAVTKANHEAAENKRKLKEAMENGSQKESENQSEIEKLQKQVNDLVKEKTIADTKASYLAIGYDEQLALDTAKAVADGDMAKVLENQKTFNTKRENDIKAELLKSTPTPPAGGGGSTVTLKTFRKMSSAERAKYSIEHPEEYKQLYGGN